MLTMATFPYIVYLTFRLKKVKNFSNKLAISGMVQFASLMMLIKAGHKFEEHEKTFIGKYFDGITIDQLKTFDVNLYRQGVYHGLQVSQNVYGPQDSY